MAHHFDRSLKCRNERLASFQSVETLKSWVNMASTLMLVQMSVCVWYVHVKPWDPSHLRSQRRRACSPGRHLSLTSVGLFIMFCFWVISFLVCLHLPGPITLPHLHFSGDWLSCVAFISFVDLFLMIVITLSKLWAFAFLFETWPWVVAGQ